MVGKAKLAQKASGEDNGEVKRARVGTSSRRVSRRASNTRRNGGKYKDPSDESDADNKAEEDSDAYSNKDQDDDEDDDAVSLNSDTLDDPDFDASGKKRKRVSTSNKPSPKKSRSSIKSPAKRKRKPASDDEDEDLENGQEVVGIVVQAPKAGRVPPGQISQNTLNFLKQLQNPDCNDRTWFKLHEPVYRLAEKEWKDFIDEFTPLLTEADPQIPILPPNDVVHRIYRDIRFSNDKTPYKTNFSASFSRSGRKGIFAGYHLCIKAGGSFFAAGTWCPGRTEIQTMRINIRRSSRRLREVISAPAFVELFGEAKPLKNGGRSNIFGMDDELKVAPKGIMKNDPDIDLLKCRSFAVSYRFPDNVVLDEGFKEEVKRIVGVTRPFVHCLNDMMTIAPDEEESGAESNNEGDD